MDLFHNKYTVIKGNVSNLSSTFCSSKDGGFCEWSYSPDYGVHDWQCVEDFSGALCEAFAEDNCIYYNTNLSYTDCGGVVYTERLYGYEQCCKGDNCNYDISDVDLDSCTRSTEFEEFWRSVYECQSIEPGSFLDRYLCDDVDEISCEILELIFREQAECECGLGTILNALVSDEIQGFVKENINEYLKGFSEWNDVFGCDINLSCDTETGEVINDSAARISTTEVNDDISSTDRLPDDTVGISAGNMISLSFSAIIWSLVVYCTYF